MFQAPSICAESLPHWSGPAVTKRSFCFLVLMIFVFQVMGTSPSPVRHKFLLN